jgi:hypothetical protein
VDDSWTYFLVNKIITFSLGLNCYESSFISAWLCAKPTFHKGVSEKLLAAAGLHRDQSYLKRTSAQEAAVVLK